MSEMPADTVDNLNYCNLLLTALYPESVYFPQLPVLDFWQSRLLVVDYPTDLS